MTASPCIRDFVVLTKKKQNYQAWKSPKGKAYQGIGEGELNSKGSQIPPPTLVVKALP